MVCTQAEKRYILETVLDHLPRVTGSERDMDVYIIQKNGYNSSCSHNEFGIWGGYLSEHNLSTEMQNEYILVVDAALRDCTFEKTFKEFQKWIVRLAKRVCIKNVLVEIQKLDKTFSYYFKSFTIDLIAFIIYVLAIILLFKLINKNYIAEKHQITVKNILLSVGIGIISLLAVILISIFLIFTKIGLLLGIVFIFAYLFLLLISIPLLILDIASLFSNRLNLYIAISLITLALYLISLIPIVGSIMMFIVILTGVGRVVNKIFIDK